MSKNKQSKRTYILNYIKQMQVEINECNNKICALKNEISNQKSILFDICPHEWYIDRDDCWDSICNKRCKFCQLWSNPNCN